MNDDLAKYSDQIEVLYVNKSNFDKFRGITYTTSNFLLR